MSSNIQSSEPFSFYDYSLQLREQESVKTKSIEQAIARVQKIIKEVKNQTATNDLEKITAGLFNLKQAVKGSSSITNTKQKELIKKISRLKKEIRIQLLARPEIVDNLIDRYNSIAQKVNKRQNVAALDFQIKINNQSKLVSTELEQVKFLNFSLGLELTKAHKEGLQELPLWNEDNIFSTNVLAFNAVNKESSSSQFMTKIVNELKALAIDKKMSANEKQKRVQFYENLIISTYEKVIKKPAYAQNRFMLMTLMAIEALEAIPKGNYKNKLNFTYTSSYPTLLNLDSVKLKKQIKEIKRICLATVRADQKLLNLLHRRYVELSTSVNNDIFHQGIHLGKPWFNEGVAAKMGFIKFTATILETPLTTHQSNGQALLPTPYKRDDPLELTLLHKYLFYTAVVNLEESLVEKLHKKEELQKFFDSPHLLLFLTPSEEAKQRNALAELEFELEFLPTLLPNTLFESVKAEKEKLKGHFQLPEAHDIGEVFRSKKTELLNLLPDKEQVKKVLLSQIGLINTTIKEKGLNQHLEAYKRVAGESPLELYLAGFEEISTKINFYSKELTDLKNSQGYIKAFDRSDYRWFLDKLAMCNLINDLYDFYSLDEWQKKGLKTWPTD
ncbi:MAG: hypothetical protein K0S74_1801 [Chlamydiales bacterium]|jgi:hypothetical protein|nr:hypothetical protein [Chlamydiales bacterium]